MFLILAVVFGLGFVALGVGTGVSGGNLGDVIQDIFSRGPSLGSVEDAREKVEENPNDPEAQLELATALQVEAGQRQRDGDTAEAGRLRAEAIAALERYTGLRPRDVNGLNQLASLYFAEANEAQRRAVEIQAVSQQQLFAQTFAPPNELGQLLRQDRIAQALSAQAAQRAAGAVEAMQREYRRVAGVYQKLALLEPEEPSVFLQLGEASRLAGDNEGAIAAYTTFLELSPDAADAPRVEAIIEQLQGLQGPADTE